MKKLIIIVIFLIRLSSVVGAVESITTEGNRFIFYKGMRNMYSTVGQESNFQLVNDLFVKTDFETYMGGYSDTVQAFAPKMINFGIGFKYKQIGFMHYCLHDIDNVTPVIYPIKNKVSFSW